MNATVGIILVVLFALGLGMLLPVLAQARRTLRVVERRLDRVGEQLEDVLDDARRISRRLDRVTEDLEEAGVPAARLVESMSDLASTMEAVRDRVGTVVAVASAVGPAVVAAVRAWRGDEEAVEIEVPSEPPPPGGDGLSH